MSAMIMASNLIEETFNVPCKPFDLQLSHWDMRMMPMFSKRLLFFSLPGHDVPQKQRVVELLLAAFRALIVQYPFLAGSIVVHPAVPWLRDVRPQGAAYFEVRDYSDELNFPDLQRAKFHPKLLDVDKLCPYPKLAYVQQDPVDVCRWRASFIRDGLALAVTIAHTVCDGAGISTILEAFTEKLRQAQDGCLAASGETEHQSAYSFDRTRVISGDGAAGDIERHPAWTTSPLNQHASISTETAFAAYHIDFESLQGLKQIVTSSDPNSNLSTHDAIAALIWRSIMLARYRAGIISSHGICYFSTAVDCRSRLKLPETYLGNVIDSIRISMTLADLAPDYESMDNTELSGVHMAAHAIRMGIKSITADSFRDLVAFVERNERELLVRLSIAEDLPTNGILLVSHFGFRTHELDFGHALSGGIEAVRLPQGGFALGLPTILPRARDGSCDFGLSERFEVMNFLERDPLFRRFALRLQSVK